MKRAIIREHRFIQDQNQTMGSCVVLGENNQPLFASLLLTRGWRNNQKNVSCIPKGTYKVVFEYSNKYKRMLWEVKGVPNRSEVKFHPLNYYFDSEGCNGLGRRPKNLNNDKYLDLTDSRNTINDFHKALEPFTEAVLIITAEPTIN